MTNSVHFSFFISLFVFSQVAIAQNNNRYCKKITTEVDKFTGEVKLWSPVTEPVSFWKYIEDDEPRYFVRLSTTSVTADTGNGVVILLDNGDRIEKDVETSVTVNSMGYLEHSAFVELDHIDLDKLLRYNISAFRLYIHDSDVKKSEIYKQYLGCLFGATMQTINQP